MDPAKKIMFYFCLTLTLTGYVSYELSDSFLSSEIKPEILNTHKEFESREGEESTQEVEYSHDHSPELKTFFSHKQKQCCFQSHFIPIDYTSMVWIPPNPS